MANIQGEGDSIAGRKYQEAQHRFAKEGPVGEAGREAAAKREAAHRDRKLDESLEQTYPASDPAPTSPGAN